MIRVGAWGRGGMGSGGAWGQTEFQVNLKLGLTPRREVNLKLGLTPRRETPRRDGLTPRRELVRVRRPFSGSRRPTAPRLHQEQHHVGPDGPSREAESARNDPAHPRTTKTWLVLMTSEPATLTPSLDDRKQSPPPRMAPRSPFVVVGRPTLNRKQGLTPRSLTDPAKPHAGLDPAKPHVTPRSLTGLDPAKPHARRGLASQAWTSRVPIPLARFNLRRQGPDAANAPTFQTYVRILGACSGFESEALLVLPF